MLQNWDIFYYKQILSPLIHSFRNLKHLKGYRINALVD